MATPKSSERKYGRASLVTISSGGHFCDIRIGGKCLRWRTAFSFCGRRGGTNVGDDEVNDTLRLTTILEFIPCYNSHSASTTLAVKPKLLSIVSFVKIILLVRGQET